MASGLGKAIVKGATKVIGEVIEQGTKEGVQQASKGVAKETGQEFAEQAGKNLPFQGVVEQTTRNTSTPRMRSTANWYRGLEDSGSIPKRSDTGESIFSEISVKELKRWDSATGGKQRGDLELLFERARSEDPVISSAAFDGLDEFTLGLHGAYHVADLGKTQTDLIRKAAGFEDVPTKPKAWNIYDELTSDKNVEMYQKLADENPGSYLDDGLAFQRQLNEQEAGSLFKYLEAQSNEVNAEFAAFLQTVDPETRAAYMDLLLDAADGYEPAQIHLRNQFETLKAERLPAEQLTQRGAEGITPEDINLGKEATNVHAKAEADAGRRTMGDKDLSALSTSPELASGDPRIYNLGTKAREIYKQFEQLLEGVSLPVLQWHHKFQKAVSTPYFQRAWELVRANKATVEDIIAMHRYALDQGVGAGDRMSAIMMLERIPHTELHNFAKAMGLELSPAKVKGTKVSETGRLTRRRPTTNSELKKNSNRISKIGTIAELAEDFQGAVQNAVFITEEGMKIQKAWREIPVAERSRLAHFHNLRNVQTDLLRKNSRKKLSAEEIDGAEKEYAKLNDIYKKVKNRILDQLKENRSKQQEA